MCVSYSYTSLQSKCHQSGCEDSIEKLRRISRQTHGHDVGKLMSGRNMNNTKLSQSHLLLDKMNIQLNMLWAAMMNGVS